MVNYLLFCFFMTGGINTSHLTNYETLILLSTSEVEIQLETEYDVALFADVKYDSKLGNLELVTTEEMHSVLIYNEDGELEFMIPVNSQRVLIGRSIFESKFYRLGFNFQEQEEIIYADVQIK